MRLARRAWLWALPLLFLGLFFYLPLGRILISSGQAAIETGLRPSFGAQLLRTLGFTAGQAGLSTLLTLLIGLPAAYLFGRFRFPAKRPLQLLFTLPFILPTVVAAAGFNALLGPNGWLNWGLMRIFGLSQPPVMILNTLTAILLAHVFYNTSVVLRVVGSAWAQLDPRLEGSARTLGASPWQAFRTVTLSLLRPFILAATVLVFLFNFTSFGVVLLLGGPKFATLEVEIYIQALQMLNLPAAGALSAVQLLCTLIITLVYTRLADRRNIPLTPRLESEAVQPLHSLPRRVFAALVIFLLTALLLLPLAALVLRSFCAVSADGMLRLTLDFYRELFINRRQSIFYVPPIRAALNSLGYAGLTVLISLSLGSLAAYALRESSRLNRVLEPVLMLPLGASAVTLGLGMVMVFNRPPFDPGSFPLLLPFAHSLVALPFALRSIQPALRSIPPSLGQAAAVLGASPGKVWRTIELPILARALLVSAVFAFTISLGEFGATAFLARPERPTLPVAIFRYLGQPGELNYGQALALSTLLLIICAVSILLLEQLENRARQK